MQRRIDPEEIKTMTSDRRSEVLASAIIVFAERGLEAAQLSSIARDAGTSLAALHREFGGKDDLFRAAVRETARGQVLRACSEPPPGPAAEQLRNFCGRCWEVLRTPSYAALHRLWVTEVPRDPDLSRFYAEEVYGTVHGMLERIIERGIVAGQFRPVVPRAAARLMMAALAEQAFWCNHADAFGPAVGGGCNRVVAETLSILLGGLRPYRQESTT